MMGNVKYCFSGCCRGLKVKTGQTGIKNEACWITVMRGVRGGGRKTSRRILLVLLPSLQNQ